MPKFVVEETIACWVTWRKEVEADSAEEAGVKFNEGHGIEEEGPFIGDALDDREPIIEIKELKR